MLLIRERESQASYLSVVNRKRGITPGETSLRLKCLGTIPIRFNDLGETSSAFESLCNREGHPGCNVAAAMNNWRRLRAEDESGKDKRDEGRRKEHYCHQ